MYPDKILGLFHLYGLMIGVGILACFSILYLYGKKEKIEESFMDFVFYNTIVAIALGFGAAALFQATYNYIENPEAGFDFGSGITFIGGLIGGVISFLVGYAIFRKKFKARLFAALSATNLAAFIITILTFSFAESDTWIYIADFAVDLIAATEIAVGATDVQLFGDGLRNI